MASRGVANPTERRGVGGRTRGMLERSSGGKRRSEVPGVPEWSGLEMYRLLGVEPTAIFKRREEIFFTQNALRRITPRENSENSVCGIAVAD